MPNGDCTHDGVAWRLWITSVPRAFGNNTHARLPTSANFRKRRPWRFEAANPTTRRNQVQRTKANLNTRFALTLLTYLAAIFGKVRIRNAPRDPGFALFGLWGQRSMAQALQFPRGMGGRGYLGPTIRLIGKSHPS